MRGEQARALAKYNRWMNERLYDVCAQLSDDDRKRDRRAFFGSIHGTLNHLVLGDRIWMGRFLDTPFAVESLDQELHADFGELRAERQRMDLQIIDWADSLSDQALGAPFSYVSIVNPALRTSPLWILVTHFFNHQTHHRGQLTTLLSQCGVDYGTTDLIWLPDLISEPDGK